MGEEAVLHRCVQFVALDQLVLGTLPGKIGLTDEPVGAGSHSPRRQRIGEDRNVVAVDVLAEFVTVERETGFEAE